MSRKRKFSDDYVQYGFTFITEKDGTQKPQCFLCSKLLCNENMKPSKLKEHFKALHPTNLDSIETLKQKRARFDSTAKLPQLGFKPVSDKPLLLASYQVAYRIAKNKKPHTIGENLVKPCAIEMVKTVLGKEQAIQIKQVSLSNDVVRSRIVDMSDDIQLQLFDEIDESPLPVAFQFDESTDVANCSQLLGYVGYEQ